LFACFVFSPTTLLFLLARNETLTRGASIATPDKVDNTLALFKPTPTEVDLDAFVAAAIRGRSNTAFAAFTFIAIQLLAFGTLFVRPALEMFLDVDF
jgi:hypothetical protein